MENNNDNQQQPPQDNPELKSYWLDKIKGVPEFKEHAFPLSRIKRIMKFDPDLTMIAAEAPILFSKACEMFIMDVTMRSWGHAQERKRSTVQRSDIAASVARTIIFDFLLDVVPEENKSVVAAPAAPVAEPHPIAAADDAEDGGLPYYYPPGMVIGTPVVGGVEVYVPQPASPAWPEDWTPAPGEEEDAAGKEEDVAGEDGEEGGDGGIKMWIGF